MPQQLSLRINLNDEATFENFFLQEQDSNRQVATVLRDQLLSGEQPFIYIWGASGSGVSHLLQASCHQASTQGLSAQYLPLGELLDYPPEQLLENLEQLSLVCLDNVQEVSGNSEWEKGLFDLFNRIRQVEGCLLLGADCSARELPLELPDLQSRFGWGPVFQLSSSNDDEKLRILQFRASRRGMELGDDVARYLINRAARGLGELIHCLDILEDTSLQERRKLSIPFIKQVFDW